MRISPQSIEFGLWCNGSTTGFGSVCLGSNPGKPTEKEQWNPLLFFCLNNSRHVIFPIPLFVAIAPLFLPYILRYKTQGRRGNTNIGYSFLPLPYPVALRGTAHKIKAEAKGEYTSTSLLAVSRSIVGHGQGGGFN